MLDRLVDIFTAGIVQALTIWLLAKLGLFPAVAFFIPAKEQDDT